MNLAKLFVWVKRLTYPCCVFFTLVFHILAFNSPALLSLNSPDMYRRKPLLYTFRLNTGSAGQDPGLLLLFTLNLHWTETRSLFGRWKWGLYCRQHSNLSHPHSQPKPQGELSWWWVETAMCPRWDTACDPAASPASLRAAVRDVIPSNTGLSPRCTKLSQEVPSGAALMSLPHKSSLGLFQPLITLSNREWRVFSILEKRSLGYWTAVESSVP